MAGRDPRIDRAEQRLIDLYRDAEQALTRDVQDALSRDAIGTARYREQRLATVRQYLSDLQDQAIPLATDLTTAAYVGGVTSAARDVGTMLPDFGSGIHKEAMEILADNLANGLNGAAETVGRRVADLYRRAGLNAATQMIAGGGGVREGAMALTSALRGSGVSAFTDAAGRVWDLNRYAEMVIRTNTADAIVRGNVNKAAEDGYDLVEVLVVEDEQLCEICSPYMDTVYSLTGREGFEPLDELPPFHPNCRCDLNILVDAEPADGG